MPLGDTIGGAAGAAVGMLDADTDVFAAFWTGAGGAGGSCGADAVGAGDGDGCAGPAGADSVGGAWP